MSVLTQGLLSRNHPRTRNGKLVRDTAKAENGSRETFWCAVNFVLFLVLGPFAAIPALFSMISLIPGDETREPQLTGE